MITTVFFHLSAQETLDTPSTFIEGAQYRGLGEPAGGNTISPTCHRDQEGGCYTNNLIWTVGVHRWFPPAVLQQLAVFEGEQRLEENIYQERETGDQHELTTESLLPSQLTQELLEDNDNDASMENVSEECTVSTGVSSPPLLGENIGQEGETGDQSELMIKPLVLLSD